MVGAWLPSASSQSVNNYQTSICIPFVLSTSLLLAEQIPSASGSQEAILKQFSKRCNMLLLNCSSRLTMRVQRLSVLRCKTRECPINRSIRKSSSLMSPLISLLQPSHATVIRDEQNMLSSLLKSLRSIDAPKDDFDLVYDTRSRIDDLFLIVIVGEFNSGEAHEHFSFFRSTFFCLHSIQYVHNERNFVP